MAEDALSRIDAAATARLDAEAALVQAARARDEDAWTAIYHQNYSRIFRYMHARVGDRETAEDLAASVFLEALKGIDGYSSRGRPLLAWLYAIARNLANYHHRSAFRRRAAGGPAGRLTTGDSEARELAAHDPATDPAAMIDGWDLRAAVSRLSSGQREVIVLRFFVGLTTPQVAAVLGKNERAVYSLYTRAIQALRRSISNR